MEAISILGFVFGVFGLIAFSRVSALRKQVYLLRLDVQQSGQRAEKTGDCGCGCGCS